MKMTGIVLAVAAGLGILTLAAAYGVYRKAFYSLPKKQKTDFFALPNDEKYRAVGARMHELMEALEQEPYEEVSILSHDGLRLAARYYHYQDGAPLKIQFHGYRSSAVRDYCGGHELTRQGGFNVLLVDQRAHGKSEGQTITMGVKERRDCLDWIRYANERFGRIPLFLYGLSMGGATVLMAADLDLPDNLLGIAADCPYSSPRDIVLRVAKEDMHIPAFLALPFLHLGSRLFGHFSLNEASAKEAVRHAKVPILLIHGEADRFVPCEMSREIAASAVCPLFWETFPDAPHGISYLTDPLRYQEIVRRFTAFCFAYREKGVENP